MAIIFLWGQLCQIKLTLSLCSFHPFYGWNFRTIKPVMRAIRVYSKKTISSRKFPLSTNKTPPEKYLSKLTPKWWNYTKIIIIPSRTPLRIVKFQLIQQHNDTARLLGARGGGVIDTDSDTKKAIKSTPQSVYNTPKRLNPEQKKIYYFSWTKAVL